jgi:hypothetical protein
MEKGWIKFRTYQNAIEAEIIKQMLEENGVPAVLINKQDSSYLFGNVELYINEMNEEIALTLIQGDIDSEEE